MKTKTILAISGSLREQSSNTAILRMVGSLVPDDVDYVFSTSIGELPHFSPELEGAREPDAVSRFKTEVRNADAVIICTPEYAFGVPGSLKNALDWTVGTQDFGHKPVALITASLSGEKGHAALMNTLQAIQARVVAELIIPFIRSKMNAQHELTDAATVLQVRSVAEKLVLESRS